MTADVRGDPRHPPGSSGPTICGAGTSGGFLGDRAGAVTGLRRRAGHPAPRTPLRAASGSASWVSHQPQLTETSSDMLTVEYRDRVIEQFGERPVPARRTRRRACVPCAVRPLAASSTLRVYAKTNSRMSGGTSPASPADSGRIHSSRGYRAATPPAIADASPHRRHLVAGAVSPPSGAGRRSSCRGRPPTGCVSPVAGPYDPDPVVVRSDNRNRPMDPQVPLDLGTVTSPRRPRVTSSDPPGAVRGQNLGRWSPTSTGETHLDGPPRGPGRCRPRIVRRLRGGVGRCRILGGSSSARLIHVYPPAQMRTPDHSRPGSPPGGHRPASYY